MPNSAEQHVVLITGPSGAGRSTSIKALEDLGFEAIDNMPLSLIPRLLEGGPPGQPLALGIDVRNREFSVQALETLHRDLSKRPDTRVDLMFLDCRADVLERRYSETRRRHPMAQEDAPEAGITRELTLLEDVRRRADVLIDTSEFTVHDLRAAIDDQFGTVATRALSVSVQSFSYKRGVPQGLDTVFDMRFLRNPHWAPELRALTGQDEAVQAYVAADPRYADLIRKITDYLSFVLPAHVEEGKTHFSVGFGCTGGQHRSVTVAQTVRAALAEQGWQVSLRHRELERNGRLDPRSSLATRVERQQE